MGLNSEKSWLLEGWQKIKKPLETTPVYGPVSTNTSGDDRCGAHELSLTSSGHHGRNNTGLGVLLTSFFLVAQVAGLGVLALPWAIARTGWAGMGLLVGAGLVVGFSACHLGYSWTILEERWPEYQRACRKPYPAMAYRSLGMFGWHVVNVVQCVTLFGVSTVTILLSAQLVASVLETALPQLTVCSWIIICGGVFVPLSWLGSPKDFWHASVVAMAAVIAAIVVVIVKVVVEAPGDEAIHPEPTFSSFFLGFGTIMFSYGGAVTFPTIQNDMADRSKFPLAVIIAFSALMVLYLPLAALGYLEFGDSVETNILLSVHGPAVSVTRVFMLVNNAFTYILVVNPLSQSLEDALGLPHEFGWRRCIVRTTIVGAGIVVSLAVQNFGKILNLIGSLAVPLLTFIMPPIFYWRLCSSAENGGWQTRRIHWAHRVCLVSVVVIGTLVTIASTWTAMEALLAPGQYEGSCFDSI